MSSRSACHQIQTCRGRISGDRPTPETQDICNHGGTERRGTGQRLVKDPYAAGPTWCAKRQLFGSGRQKLTDWKDLNVGRSERLAGLAEQLVRSHERAAGLVIGWYHVHGRDWGIQATAPSIPSLIEPPSIASVFRRSSLPSSVSLKDCRHSLK